MAKKKTNRSKKKPTAKPKNEHASAKDAWVDQPELIRQFISNRPDYDQLCNEIAYILKKRLAEQKIEFASITNRAKTLNSFLEKIQRKAYGEPLDEITDFAGVRVVSLYVDDLPKIEETIRSEFEVVEKVDKLGDKNVDQFGYGAVHFIVRLGDSTSGARYDDLKNLKCEIQTRTVLQDAWAIIQHHLVYKNESDVPQILQRKLNGLAGLFETADDQFQSIFNQRNKYVDSVRESTKKPTEFLETKVDVDSLTEFLRWKFPGTPVQKYEWTVGMISEDMDRRRYRNLGKLDEAIEMTKAQRNKLGALCDDRIKLDGVVPSAVELAFALGLTDEKFRENGRLGRIRILIEEVLEDSPIAT